MHGVIEFHLSGQPGAILRRLRPRPHGLLVLDLAIVGVAAREEAHCRLALVEVVELAVQRTLEVVDPAVRMERPPWMRARLVLAGLEHHHQRVKAGENSTKGSASDLVCSVSPNVGGHVDGLELVRLLTIA